MVIVNNFAMVKKFTIAKFDCILESGTWWGLKKSYIEKVQFLIIINIESLPTLSLILTVTEKKNF